MPFLSKLTKFASSPQGRRAINKAKAYTKSPEGRARIDKVRKQVEQRRSKPKPR